MKRFVVLGLATLLALPALLAGPNTIDLYVNYGTVSYLNNQPQIDARAFANYGTFEVLDDAYFLPYDFMNCLCYTNRGMMIGYPGFRFDYTDDFGVRRPAQNFINEYSRSVLASQEAVAVYGYSNMIAPTYLLIRATNVLSAGYLAVGNSGNLHVEGSTVNLSRGGLEVLPIMSWPWANTYWDINGDGVIDQFSPENAVYDYYWGAGIQEPPPALTAGPIYTPNIVRVAGDGVYGTSPYHRVFVDATTWGYAAIQAFSAAQYPTVSANTGVVAWATITLTNMDGSITNYDVPTNIWRQAVVVGVSIPYSFVNTNLIVRTKFLPYPITTMPFPIVSVGLEARTTNIVSDTLEVNGLYFVDYLGAETNLAVWNNHDVWYPDRKARPAAYEVYRAQPFTFTFGVNGNSDLWNGIVYARYMSNVFATNFYAGYYCMTDYLESRPPVVPGATPTNLPGRIDIVGDNVDLTKTRLRGMGAITVKANHLVSSAGAKVDVQYLAYDLASTNGLLTVQNMSKESVDRISGDLAAWSGVWTNQMAVILTNWGYDANSNWVGSVSNVPVDVSIHCLILEADMLVNTQLVTISSLNLRSTNVVQFNDPATVGPSFVVDAPCFTLNGRITFTDALLDWTYTNAPNLSYFTNNGTLLVQNVANYGTGYPDGRHLSNFVNYGTLRAAGHVITADNYQNSGLVQSDDAETVFAVAAKLEGGREITSSDIHLLATDLKLRDHVITAGRALFLGVTNSLTDSGGNANNRITVSDGFRMLFKPKSGDLLGTTFVSQAPQFASVAHLWAGEDRGATNAGFKDNAAIGKLVLRAPLGSELRFVPATGTNGLYVDYLDVTNIPSDYLESTLVIEPGLTIYFADANAPVATLDGKFGGQLRWVKDFAGPWSGVDVARHDGTTIRANRALVDSTTIDSDDDGLANGYDPYPFDYDDFSSQGVTMTGITAAQKAPFTSLVSWQAAASKVYQVEYATNLVAPKWQTLAVVTNADPVAQVLTVTDVVSAVNAVVVTNGAVLITNKVVTDLKPPGGPQRYYRVRYDH